MASSAPSSSRIKRPYPAGSPARNPSTTTEAPLGGQDKPADGFGRINGSPPNNTSTVSCASTWTDRDPDRVAGPGLILLDNVFRRLDSGRNIVHIGPDNNERLSWRQWLDGVQHMAYHRLSGDVVQTFGSTDFIRVPFPAASTIAAIRCPTWSGKRLSGGFVMVKESATGRGPGLSHIVSRTVTIFQKLRCGQSRGVIRGR